MIATLAQRMPREFFVVSYILFGLATIACADEPRTAHFGRDWVRSHPLTLMALVQQNEEVESNDLYVQAGFNAMLTWKERAGVFAAAARQDIPWHFQFDDRRGPLSDQLKTDISRIVSTYPGAGGFLVWDEPKLPEMQSVGEIVAWLKQAYPNQLIYTNLNPITPVGDPNYHPHLAGVDDPQYPYSYADYLEDVIRIIKPDVLMADTYPFWDPQTLDTEQYITEKYHLMLTELRGAARNANMPYWLFVQSYDHPGRALYPSESDVRMQVFSALGYGFTGVSYFTYGPVINQGMLDSDFQPASLYPVIAEINSEVGHIGQALRLLDSTHVGYVVGRHRVSNIFTAPNTLPTGSTAWTAAGDGDPFMTGITATNLGSLTDITRGDILIGHFTPGIELFEADAAEADVYFMIVNLLRDSGLSAEETAQSIRIDFDFSDSGINSLQRLNRQTGEVEILALVHDGGSLYHFDFILPGGTGDLFKYNTGTPFVVPEPDMQTCLIALLMACPRHRRALRGSTITL